MSQIPWWGLPLIAVVCALVGAAMAQLVTVHYAGARKQVETNRRWYEERKAAYVGLLVAFERTTSRLRVGFAAGVTEPDPLVYLNDIGPALMQVRLLAAAPVRNAALGVHKLLENLHGGRPTPLAGVDPQQHFLELLAHVPLVMYELEAAIREELDIDVTPPPAPAGPQWRRLTRAVITKVRRPTAAVGGSAADPPASDDD